MLLQLNPPIPLLTPKGPGIAHFVIDYGPESDLHWTVFLDASGECWTFSNRHIRAQKNVTLGRPLVQPPAAPQTPNGHGEAQASDGATTGSQDAAATERPRSLGGPSPVNGAAHDTSGSSNRF